MVTPGCLDSATQLGIVEMQSSADGTADQTTTDTGLSAAFTSSTRSIRTRLHTGDARRGHDPHGVMPDGNGHVLIGQAAVIDLSAAPAARSASKDARGDVRTARGSWCGGRRRFECLGDAPAERSAAGHTRLSCQPPRLQHRAAPRLRASRLDLEALAPVVRGEVPLAIQATARAICSPRCASQRSSSCADPHRSVGGLDCRRRDRAPKVPVVVKPLTNLPSSIARATLENPARLRKPVSTSRSRRSKRTIRDSAQEVGNAIGYGLDRAVALSAVTLGARASGVSPIATARSRQARTRISSIWSGDPFELTTTAEQVFISGREYRGTRVSGSSSSGIATSKRMPRW